MTYLHGGESISRAMELPLFPLKTVLLPGNKLSLKVFEPRYIDMIADCMREKKLFGVVLIYQGEETDKEVEVFTTGTTAEVVDWQNRDDGLLGITVLGRKRFQIFSTHIEQSGLLVSEVEYLDDAAEQQMPDQFFYMQELLWHISTHKQDDQRQADFCKIVYQLIYLLPLDYNLKQQLLEVPHCLDRAVVLHAELIRLGVIQYVKPEIM